MNELNPVPEKQPIAPTAIFSKIWTVPREVFVFIDTYKYDKYVTILLILSGVSRTFDRASSKNMGDHMSLWTIIIFCILVGAIFGWISYYIFAALLSWTGKWLGGIGNTRSILRVLSYALIPSIAAMVFLIPEIAVYGIGIFQSDGDIVSAGMAGNIIFYVSLILEIALAGWSIVLCVIGLSVTQQLSTAKATLNLFLPLLLLAGFCLILFLTAKFVL